MPFSNQGGYANADVDALIAKAARPSIDTASAPSSTRSSRRTVADDLPLINVAEWGFITVARDTVQNVANNPRWAVSNWADVWIKG